MKNVQRKVTCVECNERVCHTYMYTYIESMGTYLLSPICLVSCSYFEPVKP